MFISGIAQLFVFASLNTYCVDVMQKRSSEVMGANYAVRYVIAAVGSATCIPLIDVIGVGWTNTISAFLLFVGFGILLLTIRWGEYLRTESKFAKFCDRINAP